jgi:hypothetical protein
MWAVMRPFTACVRDTIELFGGIRVALRRSVRLALGILLLGGGCEDAISGTSPTSPQPDAAATIDAASGADGALPSTDASVDAPPPVTAPAPLVPGASFYPRAIRTMGGTILASVVTPLASGHLGGTILESTDDGVTFAPIGTIDDPVAQSGLCCATLYELPRALGNLPAGALVWSASIGGDTPSAPMSIRAWASRDGGRSWSPLATIATGAVPRNRGGLWEPEFSMLDDGSLVCHFSDETDPAHSQKLTARRSSDGVTWNQARDTVALAATAARPGMANVRRTPDGSFTMTYEVCGTDACAAHLRKSADGWDWGNAADAGLRPATIDGRHFRHAPTLVWTDTPGRNGRFYLVGQMVYDASGAVSAENGNVVLSNSESGYQFWYEVDAPVKVPSAYDNFCPNYSSSLLPLDGGAFALELASQYDGNTCRTYFARGRLLGSGDAGGISAGNLYRLRPVMSGLCLDVSGGSSAAGANVQQWTCNDMAAQNWTLDRAGDAFTLRAQISGMCLSVAASGNVEQQPCDGGPAELWQIENIGIGYYKLIHATTTSCLDVAGGSTMAGGNIQQWSCNDLEPQIWHVEPR